MNLIILVLILSFWMCKSFTVLSARPKQYRVRYRCTKAGHIGDEDVAATAQAMTNARNCESAGLSPGAGLATADEQADAAYADLINTSMDQRGLELSEDDIKALTKGGKMWESGSTTERTQGLFGNLKNVFTALSGGAHIEKNEFGET